MSTVIDTDKVRHIAHLSRLNLTEGEVALFTGQLARILDYVTQLERVPTEGVEPLAHALEMADVLREDTPRPSFAAAESLANAPQRERDYFRVPKVLDDAGGA